MSIPHYTLPQLARLSAIAIALQLAGCATQPASSSADALADPLFNAEEGVSLPLYSGIEHTVHPPLPLLSSLTSIDDSTLTPAPPDDLWQRLRAGLRLPDRNHPEIADELQWLLDHPDHLRQVAARAEPYLHLVLEAVEARGLPSDLALLPAVESGFDPFARSRSGALGLWQFLPDTATRFGLARSRWYEGRRDVVASTDAALNYLVYLHRYFDGDWLLALAAYNAGEGTVARALQRSAAAGRGTDFWSLQLPRETLGYVPKLLALSRLIAAPTAHGVKLTPIANQPQLTTIQLDAQIELALAAELSGLELSQIQRYNPGYRGWATAPEGPHQLLLPAAAATQLQQQLARRPAEAWVRQQSYRVVAGDTLGSIARRYQSSVAAIQAANRLPNHLIRVGSLLTIPTRSATPMALSVTTPVAISPPSTISTPSKPQQHQVVAGDTLWDIARRYQVGMAQLIAWNRLALESPLQPGQQLWIATPNDDQAPALPPRRVDYRVQRGDSLQRISQRFQVTIHQLRRWNRLPESHYLYPGQLLTLYLEGDAGGRTI